MLKVYILPVCNQSQGQKKITITSGDSNEEMPQQRPPGDFNGKRRQQRSDASKVSSPRCPDPNCRAPASVTPVSLSLAQ
jgi:hypothetical protein